jgi:hypothetical protein
MVAMEGRVFPASLTHRKATIARILRGNESWPMKQLMEAHEARKYDPLSGQAGDGLNRFLAMLGNPSFPITSVIVNNKIFVSS